MLLFIYFIIGLAFRQLGNVPVLMVATNRAVYSCYIDDRNTKVSSTFLSLSLIFPLSLQHHVGEFGCELNCCALTDHTQDYKFVIGTPQLVQFFTVDLPAQCKAFEGKHLH